jgi:hypothetical protein
MPINDLEAMAQISDMYADFYSDWPAFLGKMSWTFLGTKVYGPGTLISAVAGNAISNIRNGPGCACNGIGRDPHDCSANQSRPHFQDRGFHPDFQDSHNQPYHAWGFVAQSVDFGYSPVSWNPAYKSSTHSGVMIGHLGNITHELAQSALSRDPEGLGWGTSWQDYYLSHAGMNIGLAVSIGEISTPSEKGGCSTIHFRP